MNKKRVFSDRYDIVDEFDMPEETIKHQHPDVTLQHYMDLSDQTKRLLNNYYIATKMAENPDLFPSLMFELVGKNLAVALTKLFRMKLVMYKREPRVAPFVHPVNVDCGNIGQMVLYIDAIKTSMDETRTILTDAGKFTNDRLALAFNTWYGAITSLYEHRVSVDYSENGVKNPEPMVYTELIEELFLNDSARGYFIGLRTYFQTYVPDWAMELVLAYLRAE